MKILNKRVSAVLGAAALAATLAACGSGNSASTAPDASANAVGTTDSAAYKTAVERVKAHTTAPPSTLAALGTTQPVPAKGLAIGFSSCPSSLCPSIAKAMQSALASMGGKLIVQNNDGSPQSIQSAMASLVQAKPDAIVVTGDNPAYWSKQLQELKASNIPVISLGQPGGFTADGIAANVVTGDDYYFWGVLMMDFIATQTQGDCGNIVLDNTAAYPVLNDIGNGVQDEAKLVCPKSKLYVDQLSPEGFTSGASVPADLNLVRKDPDVRWIVGEASTISAQLQQGLKSIGADHVHGITANATPADFSLVKSGFEAGAVAFSPAFAGYRIVDAALRAVGGQTLAPLKPPAGDSVAGHPNIGVGGIPTLILTADAIKDPNADAASPVADYPAEFAKLWTK